ncbi:MAG: hypothetical protein JEY96_13520 [Bacteroidales bacterium]|nr:hypothetical protein [Bacteroidales bacterium]
MKKAYLLKILLVSIIFSLSLNQSLVLAQNQNINSRKNLEKLYNQSLEFYSINDEIINGCAYPLSNSRIVGNPFYNNDNWNTGTVFINGNAHSNLQIKYDVIIDDIIIKAKVGDGTERLLKLNKTLVDSFKINNSIFIKSNTFSIDQDNSHYYYELIYNSSFLVVKSHSKRFIDMYSDMSPYGKFSSLKSKLYLFDNKQLIEISTLNSFLKYFQKEQRKSIKQFMKTNSINYKSASYNQINELMNFCSNLIISN